MFIYTAEEHYNWRTTEKAFYFKLSAYLKDWKEFVINTSENEISELSEKHAQFSRLLEMYEGQEMSKTDMDIIKEMSIDIDDVLTNYTDYIPDKTDDVIEYLIRNLIYKMERVQERSDSKGVLEYVIMSRNEYPDRFCKDMSEFDSSKHIAAIYDKPGCLCVEFDATNHLEVLLKGMKIPSVEKYWEIKPRHESEMKNLYKQCFGEAYVERLTDDMTVDKDENRRRTVLKNEYGRNNPRTTIIYIPVVASDCAESEEENHVDE